MLLIQAYPLFLDISTYFYVQVPHKNKFNQKLMCQYTWTKSSMVFWQSAADGRSVASSESDIFRWLFYFGKNDKIFKLKITKISASEIVELRGFEA
jgi:hypothetical protein